ncbi:MAG TPA: nucleic acid/nucleotide deaminase domain-containing protein, partial [Candidatus Methylacidiphilales bacterium]|nr:nucleic acid/nucleotide deaminase domain-containing protein [Candidatus Methylacidiphilales bacterium]
MKINLPEILISAIANGVWKNVDPDTLRHWLGNRENSTVMQGIGTIARHSVRGVGHAKHLIAKELAEMGVSPSAVSRIYSELEPCCTVRGYCKKFIGKTFQ